MRYTTLEIATEEIQAIEFMIKQFQAQDEKVTRQSFVTWCLRKTVKDLIDEIEAQKARLAGPQTEGAEEDLNNP